MTLKPMPRAIDKHREWRQLPAPGDAVLLSLYASLRLNGRTKEEADDVVDRLYYEMMCEPGMSPCGLYPLLDEALDEIQADWKKT